MIKIDMTIPSYCSECPFYSGYNRGSCLAGDLYFGSTCVDMERHKYCPLQEVDEDE